MHIHIGGRREQSFIRAIWDCNTRQSHAQLFHRLEFFESVHHHPRQYTHAVFSQEPEDTTTSDDMQTLRIFLLSHSSSSALFAYVASTLRVDLLPIRIDALTVRRH